MAKSKVYAVKSGKKVGIFETWAECKEQIDGYKGAQYKSFATKAEASEYLASEAVPVKKSGAAKGLAKVSKVDNSENNGLKTGNDFSDLPATNSEAIAYVDGSYDSVTHEYASGIAMFVAGREVHFSQKFDDPEMADMRNVAGEIKAAATAMKYCANRGIKSLDIYYDYKGIEMWCLGKWKTNNPGTKRYKEFYDKEIKGKVKVRFVKVAAHSGDKYNDLADKLAKAALGKV